jgi:hypothetical protein
MTAHDFSNVSCRETYREKDRDREWGQGWEILLDVLHQTFLLSPGATLVFPAPVVLTFPPCELIAGSHTSRGMYGTPASLHPLSMRPRAVTTWAQSTEHPNARRHVGLGVLPAGKRERGGG